MKKRPRPEDTLEAHIPQQFHLSDEAYEGLVKLGNDYGYIKASPDEVLYAGRNATGMSKLLRAIGDNEWYDNRTDYIKEQSERAILEGMDPIWTTAIEKRKRQINVTKTTLNRLAWLALNHGILGFRNTKLSLASHFLEAVGVGYLTSEPPPESDDNDNDN